MVPTGKHLAVLPDRLEGTCGTPPWDAWRNRRSTGSCTTARRPATQCVATSAAAAMRTARSANRPGRRCGILGGPSTTGLGSTSVRSWCGLAAASRTTDGQFLPCSDSFTIRSRFVHAVAAGARRGARQLQWADSMRTLPSWEACSSALRAVVSSCWAASLDSATARKVFSSVVLVLSRPSGRSRWTQ